MKRIDYQRMKGKKSLRKNKSFSDFFLHASDLEKTQMFTVAAHRANEDQLRLYKEAKH